jgi:hypothetical protein
MNRIQKLATTLAGMFFAVLLLVAFVPQAARGVAAALVQIINTAANPVPNRDVDNGPRQAVTLQASCSTIESVVFEEQNGTGVQYIVPAGKRLVIEFISGNFTTPAGAHLANAFIFGNTSSGQYADYLSPNLVTAGNFNVYQLAQPMWAYYDEGTAIRIAVTLTSGSFATSGIFTLRGYLVDCTGGCF